MSSVGVEINGGGNNKIENVSVRSRNTDTKGVVVNNSSNNDIKNVSLVDEKVLNTLEQFKNSLTKINDDTINQDTNRKFLDEISDKINNLEQYKIESKNPKSVIREIISLSSEWITIKNEIAPYLVPSILSLQALIGA